MKQRFDVVMRSVVFPLNPLNSLSYFRRSHHEPGFTNTGRKPRAETQWRRVISGIVERGIRIGTGNR